MDLSGMSKSIIKKPSIHFEKDESHLISDASFISKISLKDKLDKSKKLFHSFFKGSSNANN
jgi:hypothetical protein